MRYGKAHEASEAELQMHRDNKGRHPTARPHAVHLDIEPELTQCGNSLYRYFAHVQEALTAILPFLRSRRFA